MKRRLANALTALTAATLAALILTAGLAAGAQTNEGPERTGERTTKVVLQSCPLHPEFKARSAGRCPKCRADERKMRGAREKNKGKLNRRPQPQEGDGANQ
ncbi:MAG: hypothetical protein ABW250_11910 [Pyrinomonadaceae bacterium]